MSFLPYSCQSVDEEDIQTVINTLRSPYLTQGPKVKEFEEALCEFTGAKYAVAVSNGTAALHLAMLACKTNNTHNVITTPNTFVATSNSALYCGSKVLFADIDNKTGNIDPNNIVKLISKDTRVIIPVHFAGQSCNMKKIHRIAEEFDTKIIEDGSHALGGSYNGKPIGNCEFSDMCTFSFHPVKPIATGEGGAITTNDKELYDKLVMLRSHGITKEESKLKDNEGPWYYEMQLLGYNYRLTDIQAALGISQLKKLKTFTQKRQHIAGIYNKEFNNIDGVNILDTKTDESSYHLYVTSIDYQMIGKTRQEVMQELKEKGIGSQVHYIPVYKQPYYKQLGYKQKHFPNCEEYYSKALSIPIFPKMSETDIKTVVSAIKCLKD
ncbi:UDP-4-amino-4,6-dideoxy-N-acetyl-beta-L-altrosamine transaminase [Candidatus Marinamargulisbacteria bacterium SCGC AG-343-D04]|nr:UDP-4-amino-4,6-dideoxy-N-acetyl-beta-L-altrosamine transaminase [Candidatus Marinamargulisbacteria bacterium SCGC AG-343-D04]